MWIYLLFNFIIFFVLLFRIFDRRFLWISLKFWFLHSFSNFQLIFTEQCYQLLAYFINLFSLVNNLVNHLLMVIVTFTQHWFKVIVWYWPVSFCVNVSWRIIINLIWITLYFDIWYFNKNPVFFCIWWLSFCNWSFIIWEWYALRCEDCIFSRCSRIRIHLTLHYFIFFVEVMKLLFL